MGPLVSQLKNKTGDMGVMFYISSFIYSTRPCAPSDHLLRSAACYFWEVEGLENTMSKKEISLVGRKRTRELDPSGKTTQDIQEKKEELMSMSIKPPILGSAEINLEFNYEVPVEAVKEIPKENLKEVPLGVVSVYQREVKAAVMGLIKIHYRLSEAGTLNCRAYSLYEQNKKLVQEIKYLLVKQAEFYASKNMDDEDNRQACQQYVNDIRAGLKLAGIHVNYLEVKPVVTG